MVWLLIPVKAGIKHIELIFQKLITSTTMSLLVINVHLQDLGHHYHALSEALAVCTQHYQKRGFSNLFHRKIFFSRSGYSAKDGSLAGSTTKGSNLSASPFPLGMMRPYPPAFLL